MKSSLCWLGVKLSGQIVTGVPEWMEFALCKMGDLGVGTLGVSWMTTEGSSVARYSHGWSVRCEGRS